MVTRFAAKGLFLAFVLASLTSVRAAACTTAIVSAEASSTGRPMIWKQRDADNVRNGLAHVRGERFSYTGIYADTDTQHRKTYGGINEAGFAIANNLSYNLRPDETGTQNGLLMSRALGLCETLDDFEKMLKAGTGLEISANYAVIDAHGGAAYFEAWDNGYTRYDVPKGGALYRTNFSLSGREGEGGGYVRYEAISRIMKKQPRGGFSPEFFLDASRNFINGLSGKDALKGKDSFVFDNDYIPRPWSASSTIIVGVAPGQKADSGMMWFVPGYPPCSYAIAAWVAAGENLPACISGDSPANGLAVELMQRVHPYKWEGGDEYLDVKAVKRIIPLVKRAEKTELKEARKVDGTSLEEILLYNQAADARFESFKSLVR